jgi:stage II sporulation protein D
MRRPSRRRPAVRRFGRARCYGLAAVLGLAALTAACTAGRGPVRVAGTPLPSHVTIRLSDGTVRRLPLEEYVRGTVVAEFAPASGEAGAVERMLEVQAIIARTYAVSHLARHKADGFDLCAETHCQLYQPRRLQTSRWAAATVAATTRTAGRVLWHGTAPATALFHADCGGHTSAAGDVWGGRPQPYLRAIADDGPAGVAHASWTYEIEAARLAAVLGRDSRTRVGAQLQAVRVLSRDEGGRAGLVALQGDREPLVRGEEFRTIVTRALGARSLRSTRFVVTRRGSRFLFEGQGFGHGVGLCQAGAFARIKAGARPDEVLARYYPGATVVALP